MITIPAIALLPMALLQAILPQSAEANLGIPGMTQSEAAGLAIVINAADAKKYTDSNTACDENDAQHAEFVRKLSEHAAAWYKPKKGLKGLPQSEAHQLPEDTRQKIDATLTSVRKNKMCTESLYIIAPPSRFTPKPPVGIELEACNPVRRSASQHKKKEKEASEFDTTDFKDLFPTCNCERDKFLGVGAAGVVYEVKMKYGPNLAMKIAECGTMKAEIYAQQKLDQAGIKWANKFHRWGRSAGAVWDFYIMDLIDSDAKVAWQNPGGMSNAQLREVFRISLEAARQLHYLGIAHGDFKLENMGFIANKPYEVKLIDFGGAMPVPQENGLLAFLDYRKIAKIVDNNAGKWDFPPDVFPGGVQPLYDILDEVSTQILDDKPMAQGTGGFPTRDFFSGKKVKDVTSVYEKFMEKFVELGWIDEKAKNKKTKSSVGRLFNKLPPKKV